MTPETAQARAVTIPLETGAALPGDLSLPDAPRGAVVFAHGSGSSRLSPRNVEVAGDLQRAGFATLLLDLLTDEEALNRANVFDIPLLAHRLGLATHWLRAQSETDALPVGYFGASTGAAAALVAAAEALHDIRAVVSRGGRPDLAEPRLQLVRAPTLLIVGGADDVVLGLNRAALADLTSCVHELAVVPGATHLFEEPGALEHVAELATAWFGRYVTPNGR
jgi:putative phosphoribosyl transferase